MVTKLIRQIIIIVMFSFILGMIIKTDIWTNSVLQVSCILFSILMMYQSNARTYTYNLLISIAFTGIILLILTRSAFHTLTVVLYLISFGSIMNILLNEKIKKYNIAGILFSVTIFFNSIGLLYTESIINKIEFSLLELFPLVIALLSMITFFLFYHKRSE